MKTKTVILSSVIVIFLSCLNIQAQNSPPSPECQQYLAITKKWLKERDFQTAYVAWKKSFDNCPTASKFVYINGVKIFTYRILKSKNYELRLQYADTIEMLYDKRMEYFGEVAANTLRKADFMVSTRAMDIEKNNPDKKIAALKEANELFTKAVPIVKEKAYPPNILTFMQCRYILYNEGAISGDELKEAYYMASDILSYKSDDKKEKLQEKIDAWIASAQILDCEGVAKLMTENFAEGKDDPEAVNKILIRLKRGGCTDAPIYEKALVQQFTLQPEAEKAYDVAMFYYGQDNITEAENYFKKAIELDPKSLYSFRLAQLALKNKQYQSAKKYVREAIDKEEDEKETGKYYVLLGNVYAEGAGTYSGDDFKKRTVYWVAVDQWLKAKGLDPDLAIKVAPQINAYSARFPDKEELFLREMKTGSGYSVGGWINARTVVRPR